MAHRTRKPHRADDKRAVGTALNPTVVGVGSGIGAAKGAGHLIPFNDRRPTKGAGRPKKVR